MADDTADIPPAYSTGDDWWTAVHLLTGYQPPKRGLVFQNLLGNNKIPLMKLEISDWDVSPDLAELSAINAMSWRTQNSGWRIENTDFIVPFFNGPTSVGSTVNMRKARITLLGTSSDHSVPAGGVDPGATFTEVGSHLMPDGFQGWDSRPLAQYSYGGGMALEALLNPPYSTWRYAWNDIHVDDPAAVDLTGFDRVASAFDRAAQFFHLSRATIQGWEDELGTEDASWQGQAAGVFWDIIHQLGVTYQNYTDTLPLEGYASKAGNDLRNAKTSVYNALSNLHATWSTWALYTGNPLRWLHDILLEVTDDIWDNNLVKVRAVPEVSEYVTTWTNEVASEGFRTNAMNVKGGNYGDLNDLNTWKAIGEEAVKRWQQSVVDQLGTAGSKALKDVHNAWVGINTSLQKLTTQSVSLQADYQADKAAAEQKKADDAAAAAAAHEKEMEDKADKQRAEDLAHQKEMEEKAEKERQEDLQHQKEQEEKAEKERQEQEQHQKEQEEKADKQRQEDEQRQKEQEAKQEQEQKEQEQHQKEQEAKQEQQYAQQQQEQKEEQAKQEQLQKEQEAKQEQQYAQQMAMQTAMQQEQEKKQEEQEKKQEQLQQKQEDEAKAQYEQQRKDQQDQQKKQEDEQKHQEELAQQQYAQQQKTQADYQQKQEDQAKQQYEQQRKDQQEQEAKQEQLQKEQEDKAQQQYNQQKQDQEDQAKQQFEQQKQLQQQLPGGGNGQLPGGGNSQLPGGGNGQQQLQQQLQQQQDQLQHQLENAFHGQIGSQTHVNPDGTVTTDFSDGSSTTINPHTGMETTTLPDGSVSTEHLSQSHALTNPDGSTTTVNNDGTLTTHYPDGSVTTVNPHTGTATTHEPDGQTITTPLGGGATLPHVPSSLTGGAGSLYEPELHDLPFDGSLGSAAPLATEAAIPGSAVSQSGGVLPLGTRIDGTTTGGTPQAGSPMMGGGGMGGMGGMPMGGMGGGGEKNGSGERVRQVYDDEDIVPSGGPLGRRNRRTTSYEEETAAGRRTPTAAGYDPYGGDERERTQSGDRERETWVPEEEDVWGTDEGGAPAVIG